MNVSLGSQDMIYLLELVIKHPTGDGTSERVHQKLKESIVSCLERDEDRRSREAYTSWVNSESKRIKDLDLRNNELKKSAINVRNVKQPYVGEGI